MPALFLDQFPDWFVGVAFAAVAIGALVPAAIMSIAAANLFTRNVYRDLFHQSLSGAAEATAAKRVSLVIKVGALAFILFLPTQYADSAAVAGRRLDHPDAAGRRSSGCSRAGSMAAR